MKHLKRRTLAFVCGLALLGVLATGCATLAASARGWARPVGVDKLYLVSTSKGKLTAVDSTTLTAKWTFPDSFQLPDKTSAKLEGIYGAPIVSSDGNMAYLGDYDGYVYAFKLSDAPAAAGDTAKPAAAYDLGDPVIGGLVLDEASSTLYVAAGDRLYALDSNSLLQRLSNAKAPVQVRWSFTAGRNIWSAPLRVSGGRILTASLDGKLYALDEATGSEAWSFDAGSGFVSQPVILGDKVLAGSFNGNLYAINLSDGSEAWAFKATDWVWSTPLIQNSSIYFGDFNGILYAINPSDGALQWQVDVAHGPIVAAPLLTSNTLIVATVDGWLAGYNPDSHQKLWERKVGTAIEADPALINNKVVIAPRGCVTPQGASQKTYYITVDPQTGELGQAQGIC